MFQQEDFTRYILSMGLSLRTAKGYLHTIDKFLSSNPDAYSYTYSDIMDYLGTLQHLSPSGKSRVLAGLKKYYFYLISQGIREAHPCNTMTIQKGKHSKTVIFQDLFSTEELEQLLEREERYQFLTHRNQLIMSLYIYQALTSEEIANIKLSHINLDAAKIYVPATRKLAKRYLTLKPKQYSLFEKYLQHSREQILQINNIEETSDYLFINKLGKKMVEPKHLTDVFKLLFQDRKLSPITIRKSVISNWLNVYNYPLEQVQLMAGHRWISTTLKYRQPNPEKQRMLINQWHPLG